MKLNLLLLMWLALMAGFTSQTAQAAAASPETQVTLQESFRQVRAKGRRVLLRDEEPKKERGRVGRILQIAGIILIWSSLIVSALFLVEGFLFYSFAVASVLFWPTAAVGAVGLVLYIIGRTIESFAKLLKPRDNSQPSDS